MSKHDTPIVAVVKGALAGVAGTAAITLAMQVTPAVFERVGLALPKPERPMRRKAYQPGPNTPTQELAEKVSEGILEMPLPEEPKVEAGEAIHWAYGAGWGVFFGVLAGSMRLPRHISGLVLGGLVGLVASTLVPAMRLTPPPSRQPAALNVMMLGSNLLYGWVTEQAFNLLSGR